MDVGVGSTQKASCGTSCNKEACGSSKASQSSLWEEVQDLWWAPHREIQSWRVQIWDWEPVRTSSGNTGIDDLMFASKSIHDKIRSWLTQDRGYVMWREKAWRRRPRSEIFPCVNMPLSQTFYKFNHCSVPAKVVVKDQLKHGQAKVIFSNANIAS